MPTVPSYDSFQVAQTALPGGAVRAPEMPDTAGAQAQQLGQGLMRTGDAIGRIQQDVQNKADQVRVDDALNTVTKARTDLQVDALKLKGRNALERPDNKSLPDEYSEKFDQAVNDSAKALGNDVQRAVFKQRADQMRNQLYGSLSSHMVEQQSAFQNETWKSKIETAQNQGALLWGDPAMRAEAGATVASTVDQMSKAQGWDDATKEAAMRDAMSPLHVGIMNGMIKAGHAADAKTYYETNSAGMSLQARATMQSAIKDANDTQTAEGSADDVWSKLGPKITNDPVKIFDMEAELRTQLKDNPDAMKLGLSALRQRASAFNAQQSEKQCQRH
jgi:soluble lytic murein transglycosylase